MKCSLERHLLIKVTRKRSILLGAIFCFICIHFIISKKFGRNVLFNGTKASMPENELLQVAATEVLKSECRNASVIESRKCPEKKDENKLIMLNSTTIKTRSMGQKLAPRNSANNFKTKKVLETKTKFTFDEYKHRAKTDKEFLDRILGQSYLIPDTKSVLERYLLGHTHTFTYNATLTAQLKRNFSIQYDVIVFLHIQKTGGRHFNHRIKSELQLPFKCLRSRESKYFCKCLNPSHNMWFYNYAYSVWQCGLHADWTVMHKCVPGLVEKIEKKRRQPRYFYFTQLRDGVERYLSEYHHQTAHNHWQSAILGCGKTVNANKRDVKPCFRGRNWKGVTLDNFMACKDNLATHRMTRMLADLQLAGCYTNFTDESAMKKRAPVWLESAKNNLQTMEYIGLMEDEPASDKLFYKTYKLKFKTNTTQESTRRNGADERLTEEQFLKVLRLAELDIHLYLFGKDLFYKRLQEAS